MKAGRLLSVCVVLVMLATVSVAAAATPLASPCMPGSAYDPACDVDHNGTINVTDIQLIAGHWGQTGTYNIYPAMVPKTGQTICYDSFGYVTPCHGSGQDGEVQNGVAWPIPRFTDNNNGTVTDNLTGLIWLKNANCFSFTTWATQLYFANSLNSGECGLTDGSVEGDWRLPNVREMQSLIDFGRYRPPLPSGHPFTNVQWVGYWTSTTYAESASSAWRVSLDDGDVAWFSKILTGGGWPVRGGQ